MAALPGGQSVTGRLHTAAELRRLVEELGFLPLFRGRIPGFSVEEMTAPEDWFSGNPAADPWLWREELAAEGALAYGKFFAGKAGFISRDCLPAFCNLRRDGYDFDARWDDGLAPQRHKRIMDRFEEEPSIPTWRLRKLAGFGKDGEKGFEGAVTALQMQTYLCIRAFVRRNNRAGAPYGWPVGLLTTPEALFGADWISGGYDEPPARSRAALVERCRAASGASEAEAARLIG